MQKAIPLTVNRSSGRNSARHGPGTGKSPMGRTPRRSRLRTADFVRPTRGSGQTARMKTRPPAVRSSRTGSACRSGGIEEVGAAAAPPLKPVQRIRTGSDREESVRIGAGDRGCPCEVAPAMMGARNGEARPLRKPLNCNTRRLKKLVFWVRPEKACDGSIGMH
jgi:hypothetical protein